VPRLSIVIQIIGSGRLFKIVIEIVVSSSSSMSLSLPALAFALEP